MKKKKKIIPNGAVKRIVTGIPPKHKHIRTVVELEDETLILQEATIANLLRAYINIKTHPRRLACELMQTETSPAKKGYAETQLLETETPEKKLLEELHQIINE